jgi:glucose-1-phosphate thymidylyltransferase
MKVVIPLAGKGTRMRPHTHSKPKPMLPVAGKTNIDHILDLLKDLDVSEYIFITGHLKEYVEAYMEEKGIENARYVEQKVKDGTAGAIRLAKEFVDEPVLIIFADTVFETDLSIIKTSDDDGILWAQEVEDYQRFGVIVQDENGHMTKIVEKPSEPISKLANIGLYYIKDYTLLFEGIEHVFKEKIVLKGEYYLTDAFQYMVDNGAKLKVEPVDGWYDCGKPETTLESNALLLKKHHAVKSETKETKIIEPVFIDEGCTIEGSEIGPNVHISKGCTIKNAKLHDCIIDENATVQDISIGESILGSNTFLEGEGREKKYTMRIGCNSHTSLK